MCCFAALCGVAFTDLIKKAAAADGGWLVWVPTLWAAGLTGTFWAVPVTVR